MTPPPAATDPQRFLARLRASLEDGSFQRLVLGRPHDAEPTLEKLLARPVLLRGERQLSLVWRHLSKDITKNLPLAAALDELALLIDQQFHHAHLVTRQHDVQLSWAKKGHWTLRVGKLQATPKPVGPATSDDQAPDPQTAHDRPRQHALQLSTPFLAELGVTDAQGRLVPAMARKWRQINKFAEVLGHALAESPLARRPAEEPVRVLDFGAGRGYLTFAVHQQLQAAGRAARVTGVELRPELTQQGNEAAQRLGLSGLHFATGDVNSHPVAPMDVMIALHACDTATDVAMHRGVASGAAIILCSPCCHKELRPQMHAPDLLKPLLRHGIHMGEQAEMLTDGLRALLLQACGYDTQVFEFISPEHTAKNKMVLAVRRSQPLPAAQATALMAQLAALKAAFGVQQQTLETLLRSHPATAGRLPPAVAA